MKPIWKHIIASVCALIIVAYLVFGVYMSYKAMPDRRCSYMHVQITDQVERQYVSEAEIRQLILSKGLNPISKASKAISLQAIEDIMRQHPMVRTAECYETMQGDVCVRLTQRVPLVRVVTGGETYFVDTDRKIMPVWESVKTPVLVVTGDVSKRMAIHEISDFAEWLDQSKYWKSRVARAEVCNPHMVHMIQHGDAATIILGNWSGVEQKMGKLEHWYKAGSSLNLDQYAMVDLRFHGQVIGIRNKE